MSVWRSLVCLARKECRVFIRDDFTDWLRQQEDAARLEADRLAAERRRRQLMESPLLPKREGGWR